MDSIILRNSRAEQYLCAARKNFIMKDGCLSESHSKTVFCHFSDLHSDWERFSGIIKMLKYYKPDFAVHTGDVVCWDSAGDTSVFYDEINKIDIPVYSYIGNHETFCGDKTLKNEDLHERYIKPLKNIHTTGKAYYYTDFPEHNIRLIVLNDYDNDEYEKPGDRDKYEILQEQCDWFIGVLKECEKKRYGSYDCIA